MLQLSKQSYNESKFKLESEGGSSSDFDDNDYSLEKNYEFLDLGIKEESLDVKREKLQDLDHEENVVRLRLHFVVPVNPIPSLAMPCQKRASKEKKKE